MFKKEFEALKTTNSNLVKFRGYILTIKGNLLKEGDADFKLTGADYLMDKFQITLQGLVESLKN